MERLLVLSSLILRNNQEFYKPKIYSRTIREEVFLFSKARDSDYNSFFVELTVSCVYSRAIT